MEKHFYFLINFLSLLYYFYILQLQTTVTSMTMDSFYECQSLCSSLHEIHASSFKEIWFQEPSDLPTLINVGYLKYNIKNPEVHNSNFLATFLCLGNVYIMILINSLCHKSCLLLEMTFLRKFDYKISLPCWSPSTISQIVNEKNWKCFATLRALHITSKI